ncbi:MAG TPA: hypothetical protein V6D14_30210 [Coleofasciculaceae cyanobacterium]
MAVALNEAQKWLRDLTKQKLEEWVKQGKVPLTPTRRIAVLGWLRNMEADDKPFESPQYWAAFCAIGQ